MGKLQNGACYCRRPFSSSFSGTNLGRFTRVLTRDTPSRADQSIPPSEFISSLPSSTAPDRMRGVNTSRFSFSLSSPPSTLVLPLEAIDKLFRFESRKRQTTAQSSTFEVEYLYLQARTATSTNARAADERAGADAIISTTS
ncbi:hypothetical protein V6N13_114421 [Hibiscus sabdariffa]